MQLQHSCDVKSRSQFKKNATADVLADFLTSKYGNGKVGRRPCEILELVLSNFHVFITYSKAWTAKEYALSCSRGNEAECFNLLTSYLHLLRSSNPGTIYILETSSLSSAKLAFKYPFLALGASVSGYNYLRKVIVIDDSQLKGKFKGCLVAASGQDGNMQIFPLAFAFIDGENKKEWSWFVLQLQLFVPDGHDIVFILDIQAAIYSSLKLVYPLALHGTCVVHLYKNVNSRFKSLGLAALASDAECAFTIGEFKHYFDQIKQRSPGCVKYLEDIGLPHWALSYFLGVVSRFQRRMTRCCNLNWCSSIWGRCCVSSPKNKFLYSSKCLI